MNARSVGWIGVGRLGLPMAERAARAGFPLRLWSRRPDVSLPAELRAERAQSVGELASHCDVVVTVLGSSADVLDVQRRMLGSARAGSIFIDMTTAAPAVATALEDGYARRGVLRLDAPVTGGVAGARDGRLAIMVGGEASTLETVRSLLEALGNPIVHCGGAGAGYRMKLVNQIAMAGALLGFAEAAAFASAASFDPALVMRALGTGTASGPLFHAYLPRLMPPGGPVTFTLGTLRKDLRLAREEASLLGCSERWLHFVLAEVDAACARFGADTGVQALGYPRPAPGRDAPRS